MLQGWGGGGGWVELARTMRSRKGLFNGGYLTRTQTCKPLDCWHCFSFAATSALVSLPFSGKRKVQPVAELNPRLDHGKGRHVAFCAMCIAEDENTSLGRKQFQTAAGMFEGSFLTLGSLGSGEQIPWAVE